jgi:cupredoxin-like protein
VRRPQWLISSLTLALTLAAALVYAADTPAEISLMLDKHRFSPEEIQVKANVPFVLVITNKDNEDEDLEMAALRIDKTIPAGKTVSVKMPALKPGTYEFIGEFHEKTAKGRILAK